MQDLILAQVADFGVANSVSCGAAAVVGLLSHWLYFIRGPRILNAFGIVMSHLLAFSLLFLKTVSGQGLVQGFVSWAAISGSYLAALYTSIGIYRLFFHPLRKFPGPFPAKIAKPYIAWVCRDWKIQDHFVEWHAKYGDFVRTGPNDVSIVNLDAFSKLHGPQGKATKKNTGFYDRLVTKGELNLDTIWDNEMHRDRRRVWDQALGTKALERYEDETRSVLRTFLGRLEELEGKPVNTTLYSKLIPFDNMGRVAFSRDFGTVKEGRDDRMLEIIEATFKLTARMGQMPWPLVFFAALPRFGMQKEFEDLGERFVNERIATETEESHDMMKYFLADYRSEKPKTFHNINMVYADSHAILIGATDTISCALAFSFYFLARDPEIRQRLYEAIASVHGKTLPGEFVMADLVKLELLEAFVFETLRMHAPVPLNGPRIAPPEGAVVDGTYIPGGVTITTPPHLYHRSPKYWKQPDDFIPERWTTRPDLIIDRRAFVPFHYGRFDCVGRRLAFNVLKLTIAYTLWNYDFGFAPGEDGSKVVGESMHQLILKAGSLHCVFKKRPEAEI